LALLVGRAESVGARLRPGQFEIPPGLAAPKEASLTSGLGRSGERIVKIVYFAGWTGPFHEAAGKSKGFLL
jgi:hypothetical protein